MEVIDRFFDGKQNPEGEDRCVQFYIGRNHGEWKIVEVLSYGYKEEHDSVSCAQDCLEARLDGLGDVVFYGVYGIFEL